MPDAEGREGGGKAGRGSGRSVGLNDRISDRTVTGVHVKRWIYLAPQMTSGYVSDVILRNFDGQNDKKATTQL